jgi:hypothetical protein
LDLDHELAYSSIAEAETSSLDILSIPCNTLRQSTDDGYDQDPNMFLGVLSRVVMLVNHVA